MDVSLGRELAHIGLRLTQWVRSRTFSAPPLAWRALVLAASLVAALLFALGGLLPAALCFVVGLACGVPLLKWKQLQSGRGKPLVILARFRSENPAYENIATTHVHQIERRIHRNDLLDQAIDLRTENIPLTESQARRLMEKVHAVAVVSGSGLAVSDHARWEGWVLSSWPGQTARTQEHNRTEERRMVDIEDIVDVGEQDDLPADAEQELAMLTAEVFPATHAKATEAFLLVSAGAWTSSSWLSGELMDAADSMRDDLPMRARAVLELHRVSTELERSGDIHRAVATLQAIGEDVDHELIWDTCFMLMTYDSSYSTEQRLQIAERSVAANANYVPALTNVGLTLLRLGRQEEARQYLLAAHECADPHAPSNLDAMLAAHLFFAGGDQKDWLRWLGVYNRVRRHNKRGMRYHTELTRTDLRSKLPPEHFGQSPWSG